jgi:FAD/FMN-containing dehydrogenase
LALLEERFPFLRAYDFGHWGDGGCHFNLVWPDDAEPAHDPATVNAVRTALYELVVDGYGGSFSAEHGVGPYNLDYYRRFVPEIERAVAGRLQDLFDPQRRLGNTDFG